MNGLTILSGINYSGKGHVATIVHDQWPDIFDGAQVEIFTLSSLMRQVGGLSNYDELSAMPVDARNALRFDCFAYLRFRAAHVPVLLDTHFVFEDGEHVDFSPLGDITKQILVVTAEPDVIAQRSLRDESNAIHPGRRSIAEKGLLFIRRYTESDMQAARRFKNFLQEHEGRTIPFCLIENNGSEANPLQEQIQRALQQYKDYREGHVRDDNEIYSPSRTEKW